MFAPCERNGQKVGVWGANPVICGDHPLWICLQDNSECYLQSVVFEVVFFVGLRLLQFISSIRKIVLGSFTKSLFQLSERSSK